MSFKHIDINNPTVTQEKIEMKNVNDARHERGHHREKRLRSMGKLIGFILVRK